MNDDATRYKEYLQKKLLSETWKHLFTPENAAKMMDSEGLAEHATQVGENAAILVNWQRERLRNFAPDTPFEQPDVALFFQPIMGRIDNAAKRIGFNPLNSVSLATSTDVGPSPSTLSTSTGHTIFIGIGTGKFCNAWAKAYLGVARAIWTPGKEITKPTVDQVRATFAKDPDGLYVAFRLAVNFGLNETVVGVDDLMRGDAIFDSHKAHLLDSMEMFALAHEYVHCVAHERYPVMRGILTRERAFELETICDIFGVRLSQESTDDISNKLSLAGIGAVMFLRAMEISTLARSLFVKSEPTSSSHPPIEDRIADIKKMIEATAGPKTRDFVTHSLDCYDGLAVSLKTLLLALVFVKRDKLLAQSFKAPLPSDEK
ncbi:MAG TPA: hypothetical protein VGM73_15525 [Candidatus Didemnitutus sp.]|jgi:hypothetical protein